MPSRLHNGSKLVPGSHATLSTAPPGLQFAFWRPQRPLSALRLVSVRAGQQPSNMEEVSAPRGPVHVKDVPCDLFISAFAAYLKQTNKVRAAEAWGRASRPMMRACSRAWRTGRATSRRSVQEDGRTSGCAGAGAGRRPGTLCAPALAGGGAGGGRGLTPSAAGPLVYMRLCRSSCPSTWTT